jgi:hypothetical protein
MASTSFISPIPKEHEAKTISITDDASATGRHTHVIHATPAELAKIESHCASLNPQPPKVEKVSGWRGLIGFKIRNEDSVADAVTTNDFDVVRFRAKKCYTENLGKATAQLTPAEAQQIALTFSCAIAPATCSTQWGEQEAKRGLTIRWKKKTQTTTDDDHANNTKQQVFDMISAATKIQRMATGVRADVITYGSLRVFLSDKMEMRTTLSSIRRLIGATDGVMLIPDVALPPVDHNNVLPKRTIFNPAQQQQQGQSQQGQPQQGQPQQQDEQQHTNRRALQFSTPLPFAAVLKIAASLECILCNVDELDTLIGITTVVVEWPAEKIAEWENTHFFKLKIGQRVIDACVAQMA